MINDRSPHQRECFTPTQRGFTFQYKHLTDAEKKVLNGRNDQYADIVKTITLEVANGIFLETAGSKERRKNLEFAKQINYLNGQPLTPEEETLFDLFMLLAWTDEQTTQYFIARYSIDGG